MTTLVFPGQGSQFVGMSKVFFDNFKVSQEVFEEISDVSDIDMKDIIFNNPSDLLNQTQYTQLSIFCASISIFKAFIQIIDIKKLNIQFMLGHSLGEYSALVAANILSIKDCSLLLKTRGELMQNAYEPNQSGMAAIIGLNCDLVEKIINDNNLNLQIANDNSPLQIVISGIKKNLLESKIFFKNAGAKKFLILNVSAAFHSYIMKEAQLKLNKFIKDIKFEESSVSIISNYTGNISINTNSILDNLSKQMANRVRWVESIISLENIGEKNIIEIGPGKVLTGLIKRITNNFNLKNIETISDIEDLKNEY